MLVGAIKRSRAHARHFTVGYDHNEPRSDTVLTCHGEQTGAVLWMCCGDDEQLPCYEHTRGVANSWWWTDKVGLALCNFFCKSSGTSTEGGRYHSPSRQTRTSSRVSRCDSKRTNNAVPVLDLGRRHLPADRSSAC